MKTNFTRRETLKGATVLAAATMLPAFVLVPHSEAKPKNLLLPEKRIPHSSG